VVGCGEQALGKRLRRLIAKRRMWALLVVICCPSTDHGARMVHVAEHDFVEEFIAHAHVETLHKPILHRLGQGDLVPFDPLRGSEG